MIFNCPECEKKYVLSSNAIGPNGKTVRCVNCAHEWFQMPEQDPYPSTDDEEDDFDTISSNNKLGGYFDDEDDEDNNAHSAQEKPLEDIIRELSSGNLDDDDTPDNNFKKNDNKDKELDIPKGVKPVDENINEEEEVEKPSKPKKIKKEKKEKKPKALKQKIEEPMTARLMGFAAAIAIFFIIILGALMAKPAIVSAWPPAAAIYDLAGMPVSLKGEGLIIEGLIAELSEDQKTLTLKGNIVNLREKQMTIPLLKASFKLTETDPAKQWFFGPPQNTIAAEDSLEFSASYNSPPADITMVNVTFETTVQ